MPFFEQMHLKTSDDPISMDALVIHTYIYIHLYLEFDLLQANCLTQILHIKISTCIAMHLPDISSFVQEVPQDY